MGKKTKNRYYAYITETSRGIAASWPDCEGHVKGRKAHFKGFPDRASAERWLNSGGRAVDEKGPRKYYAYRTSKDEGVVTSWVECEARVQGKNARYRSFPDRASALKWLDEGAPYADKKAEKAEALAALPEDAIFFDSGTGPGRGVELRVTDHQGAPMVHLAEPLPEDTALTKEGNLLLGFEKTNNFGELLACHLALRVAETQGVTDVFGDSRLVLDYWSKGHVSTEKRRTDPAMASLARKVSKQRKEFEGRGGRLHYVSGSINPADLGYHRD